MRSRVVTQMIAEGAFRFQLSRIDRTDDRKNLHRHTAAHVLSHTNGMRPHGERTGETQLTHAFG